MAAAEEAHKGLQVASDLRSFYVQLSLASSLAALGRLDEARKPAEELQLVRSGRLTAWGCPTLASLLAWRGPCLKPCEACALSERCCPPGIAAIGMAQHRCPHRAHSRTRPGACSARFSMACMQAIFIKAHHRFGPFFSHQIVTRLHRLGLQLEDLSSGLSKCSIVRCAMDTATVSLAAWQLLRKCAQPVACTPSAHVHADLCDALPLTLQWPAPGHKAASMLLNNGGPCCR